MKKIYIIDTNILQLVFSTFSKAKDSLPAGSDYGIVWREIKNYILDPQDQSNLLQYLDLKQQGSRWVIDLFVNNQPDTQLVIPSQTYNEAIYGLSSKVNTLGTTYNTMDVQQQQFAGEKKKILDALRSSQYFNGPNIEIELINMSLKDSPKKLVAVTEIPILELVIPALESELLEMTHITGERWDRDNWQSILVALKNSDNLTTDQDRYKRRLEDYKAYTDELIILKQALGQQTQIAQTTQLNIKAWLKTTDDPFFTELIDEGVRWYRDLHTVTAMDDAFEEFKVEAADLVNKFNHIKQYFNPLLPNPGNIDTIIKAYDPLTLQNYNVPESLDRNTVQEAKEKVIDDLVIRFSHNNEELDIGDFKIARYAFKYKSSFPSDEVLLVTFNTKQLGELSAPNFLYNLYGLKINFPQIEGVAYLGFDGLRLLFRDNLNNNIAQIDTALKPLLAVAETRTLVEPLNAQLLEYYNTTPLPTSADIFHDIRMLNNLKVESGQVVIDLDKLLQNNLPDVKNILFRLKDKVFTNINMDNIKTLRTDAFTIQKIQDVIDKINNPSQIFKPLEYLHTLYKYQSLLSVDSSGIKIDLKPETIDIITPEILKDIHKKLFVIHASSFVTHGTSPVLMDKIDDVVRYVGIRNSAPLIRPLEELKIEIHNLPIDSMPTSCGIPGSRKKRDLSSCLDVNKIKQRDEVIVHDNKKVNKIKLGAKLHEYSNKLDIALMLRQVVNMNPEDIPQAGAMIGAPVIAQLGLQKFINTNPKLGEHLLKNIDQAFKNLPLTIKKNIATDILHQLTKSTGINLLKNSPLLIGPIINTIWSGINIYEAAEKLNSEEGKKSEGILIFTIVSEGAIITCSLLQGGALAMSISAPGLNIAITTIVIVQQLAYAISNGIDKVKEVNSKLSLSTAENIEVFFRNIVGKGLPEYLENNLIATSKYNDLISEAIKNANNNFDVIAITLPTIEYDQLVTLENPCSTSRWNSCGARFGKCTPQTAKNIHFSNDNPQAKVLIKSFSVGSQTPSRIIAKALQEPQQFICTPTNNDASVEKVVTRKCDPVNSISGRQIGKLSLHTSRNQGNICDSAVMIDLDPNTTNSNILYNIDGEVSVIDPATSTMTSILMIHPNTNVTKAPIGTNYFIPVDNEWREDRVNLSGNEVHNIVRLTSSTTATNFNPDTKVDLLLAKDCRMSINNSPSIKSLGNNDIIFRGNNRLQIVEVGNNDHYHLDLNGSSKIKFEVSNIADNDTLTVSAYPTQSETELIISINTQFIFLSSLKYNKELNEWSVTLANTREIKIYNYANLKNCILQFHNGISINLKQFQELTGNISIGVNNKTAPWYHQKIGALILLLIT